MAVFPRPVSSRRQALKSRSRKAQFKSRSRRQALKQSSFTPYNLSLRGTNPQKHVKFGGKGFPDMLTINLTYSDSFVLDPSSSTICPFKTYRFTSPFDPDFSLGGGQPAYWDQLSLIYDRYCVKGAKMTAMFSQGTRTTGNIGPYIVGINCSDLTSLPSTNGAILLTQPNTTSDVYTIDKGVSKVVATYSRDAVYQELNQATQARCNANPDVNWFANVFATPQGVDVESPINVMIIIEYVVTLSDLRQVLDA